MNRQVQARLGEQMDSRMDRLDRLEILIAMRIRQWCFIPMCLKPDCGTNGCRGATLEHKRTSTGMELDKEGDEKDTHCDDGIIRYPGRQ